MTSKQESATAWLGKKIVPAKGTYLAASVLTFLSAVSFLIFSWYLAVFAASWLVESELTPVKLVFASAFLAARYVFAHFASQLNYRAGNRIVSNIRKELYPKLLNNNQFDSVSGTLLVTKVSDDLKPFYSFFVPYAIASVLVAVMILIVSFILEKWVGIVLLVSLIIIPLLMMVIGVGAEALHKKHINLFMKYSAVFYNRLNTIAEIVNLNNLKQQYIFLSEKSRDLNTATTKVMQVAILSSAVLELFVTISMAAIAIYLGMSLLGIMTGPNYGKGYDFQKALFLLTITPYFFFYLRKFVSAYHDRNKALASAKLIMPVLNEVTDEPVENVHVTFNSLEIKNLDFAYPDTMVKVLHNIHWQLPAKGVVLVKGISGSGKSTLLKILAGCLPVETGLVAVNGKDNRWSKQWLKLNSSYMNQYPFIFDGTIHYNVFLQNENEIVPEYPAFLDKILAKKEQGWQTELSHNGKQLSGGERQLITLARMMLFPKPIAILDEPTSNLDADTVEIMLEQIQKFAENRLVIVASHEDKFDAIAHAVLQLNWGEQM